MKTEQKNKEYEAKIAKLREEKDALWDKYQEKADEIRDLQVAQLDMNFKFYKVKTFSSDDTYSQYIFVTSSFLGTDKYDRSPAYILNCFAFSGHVTDYMDMTYMRWDQLEQIYIKCENSRDLEDELSRFVEITKEEYNEAFNKLVQEVIKEHNSFDFKEYIKANSKVTE